MNIFIKTGIETIIFMIFILIWKRKELTKKVKEEKQ
jgi:hypothetical protein